MGRDLKRGEGFDDEEEMGRIDMIRLLIKLFCPPIIIADVESELI